MKDLEHFVKMGKKEFGYEGTKLEEWATAQVNREIEAAERVEKAAREARAAEAAQRDADRAH